MPSCSRQRWPARRFRASANCNPDPGCRSRPRRNRLQLCEGRMNARTDSNFGSCEMDRSRATRLVAPWFERARANRAKAKTGLTNEEREELTRLRKENRGAVNALRALPSTASRAGPWPAVDPAGPLSPNALNSACAAMREHAAHGVCYPDRMNASHERVDGTPLIRPIVYRLRARTPSLRWFGTASSCQPR